MSLLFLVFNIMLLFITGALAIGASKRAREAKQILNDIYKFEYELIEMVKSHKRRRRM